MLVKTNFLGVEETIEVSEEQIFSFDPGIGGFESLRRYALIPEQDSPVEWLQSLEDPDVAFALLEPFAFKSDYAFELSDADAEALGMREAQDALVRCVLTLHEDPEKITANLLAPLQTDPDREHVMTTLMQPDRLHPNAEGVGRIVSSLGPVVLELLQKAE